MTDIVQKLWGFCHTLRHDGIDYGDYIEQITFLLFLKMANEKGVDIPKGCDWGTLRAKSGTALLDDYSVLLRKLGKTPGILGDIYAEAQSRFALEHLRAALRCLGPRAATRARLPQHRAAARGGDQLE